MGNFCSADRGTWSERDPLRRDTSEDEELLMLDWCSERAESPRPPLSELPGRNGGPILQGDMVLIEDVPYRVTQIWASYVVLCKLVQDQQTYYGDAAWFTETCDRIEPHYAVHGCETFAVEEVSEEKI